MNEEMQLKLQACLDGELPDREAREVAEWVAQNPDAKSLLEELRLTAGYLKGAELDRVVPESREFYWSKILQGIERTEREVPQGIRAGWISNWRRVLAPLAGFALVAFLGVALIREQTTDPGDPPLSYLAEVETPTPEVGAYSFRSQSGNMFVVWLYERTPEPAPDPLFVEEMFTQ
jgi:anti-sigma factor RsiW